MILTDLIFPKKASVDDYSKGSPRRSTTNLDLKSLDIFENVPKTYNINCALLLSMLNLYEDIFDLGEAQRRVGIKGQRRQDLHHDGVRDPATASGRGRLKEDLESSTWQWHHEFKATYPPRKIVKLPGKVFTNTTSIFGAATGNIYLFFVCLFVIFIDYSILHYGERESISDLWISLSATPATTYNELITRVNKLLKMRQTIDSLLSKTINELTNQSSDYETFCPREIINELELRMQRRNNFEEELFKDMFPTEEELAYHKGLLGLGHFIDGRLSKVVLEKPVCANV
ncbi:hypothetical protein Tco_0138548 [Tanacetum coccineum]